MQELVGSKYGNRKVHSKKTHPIQTSRKRDPGQKVPTTEPVNKENIGEEELRNQSKISAICMYPVLRKKKYAYIIY